MLFEDLLGERKELRRPLGKKEEKRTMEPTGPYGNSNDGEVSFREFFDGWIERQQDLLNELLMNARNNSEDVSEDESRRLVSRVLLHYQEYYDAKSIASKRDVFILFSPPWFSPYERTFLWIAGIKPGLILRILIKSVRDLSGEQVERVRRLTVETKAGEKELKEELAGIQERVAGKELVDLAKRGGRMIDGETLERDSEFQNLKEAMEGLVVSADHLRTVTTQTVVEILSPAQAVTFLTASAQLQMKIRIVGLKRDEEMRHRRRPRHESTTSDE